MAANKYQLDNLIAIIDRNNICRWIYRKGNALRAFEKYESLVGKS